MFTVTGTNTAYDGGAYIFATVQNTSPYTYTFSSSINASFTQFYNDLPVLIKSNSGKLLNFYREATSHSTSPGRIMLKSSTDNGATWTFHDNGSGGTDTNHGCLATDPLVGCFTLRSPRSSRQRAHCQAIINCVS
jgi:hypothetical protein